MINCKKFRQKDIENFVFLSKKQYSNEETTNSKHILWKHCLSPLGKSEYITLKHKNKIIGRSLLQPQHFKIGMKTYKIALVTDVLIDPNYRFPPTNFIKLTKACEKNGSYDFIYHTSNNITENFYRKLFNFNQPIKMKSYGFPIKLSNFIKNKIGFKLEILDLIFYFFKKLNLLILDVINLITDIDIIRKVPSDQELKSLINQAIIMKTPIFIKNQRFLKWRFETSSLWRSKIFSVVKDNKNLGYFCSRIVRIDGIYYFTVLDFFYSEKLTKLELFKIRLIQYKMACELAADAIFTMTNPNSNIGKNTIGYPFLRIPDSLLPHKTPIFFRSLPISISLPTISKTHITLADLDYF